MDSEEKSGRLDQLGGQMSFLEHLDELRIRLVRSIICIAIAFGVCWYFSGPIYRFLDTPVRKALADAQQKQVPVEGITGQEKILPLSTLKPGDKGRYIFDVPTRLEVSTVPAGASVQVIANRDVNGNLGLYTEEPIYTSTAIIPSGIRLPFNFEAVPGDGNDPNARMIVTTALEPFTLYITVSIYAAIALSMPFLLLQVWGFISPALYKHERGYVTPFILLSSLSFITGAAFGYYILFPPAVKYLLGVGEDFNILLKATDYFDFITIIMLAMGLIFQMPAISYVLSRIGIVSAGLLVRSWKIAIIVILLVAAVASPTPDVPNMMLFAAPMFALYVVSIFIAWFFGKRRTNDGGEVV